MKWDNKTLAFECNYKCTSQHLAAIRVVSKGFKFDAKITLQIKTEPDRGIVENNIVTYKIGSKGFLS